MFFVRMLEKTITLHPSYFGPNLQDFLIRKLLSDVEGSCTGTYYIICVIDNLPIELGRIIPGRGDAEFTIQYKAVVWRPFKGEAVDGIVDTVSKLGIFVEVGPLRVFVSHHMIPAEFQFDAAANPPQFVDMQGQLPVTKGAHVRIKLIGVRTDLGSMQAVGTMKDDYLGPL